MKREITVVIYGDTKNNSVIRFSDRKNASIAIQADSFRSILDRIDNALMSINSDNIREAKDELEIISNDLHDMYNNIKNTIEEAGDKIL